MTATEETEMPALFHPALAHGEWPVTQSVTATIDRDPEGHVTGVTRVEDGRTETHAVRAGYDGEGVYGWSCTCGAGESDFTDLDHATIAATEHLLIMGEVPQA